MSSMITITEQDLRKDAENKGYRPENLEKVYRLLDLLEQIMAVSYLKERLVLKCGTAINLFCADVLPRLSIDLDFNYIGSVDLESMQKERPQLVDILIDVCERKRYRLRRNPTAHAGGKMEFEYDSILGNKGRLEIDLNFIFRIPLLATNWCTPTISWLKPTATNILDIHELAAGKLHALLGREASRDLFDSHQLLINWPLDEAKLRLLVTVYAGMERDSWKHISADNITFTVKDIRDKLIPVLQRAVAPSYSHKEIDIWAKKLVGECKEAFVKLLPFRSNEIEFLEFIENESKILPELLSEDEEFCSRVKLHPSLLWRAKQSSR